MTFFYDLNKRLAALASKQDAKQIAEDAKATAPKSKLAESIEVAERATSDYSAKKGAAGKDLGKPGKNFAKIAKTSGGGEKGQRIAGAVLNKLRGKTEEAAVPMTPKQKSFAKLAPPTDKITFADKIAGAKKEVDEMLGDVAAEAIKSAIGHGKQQVADEGNAFTGKLKTTPKGGKFKMGNKEFTDNSEVEEGFGEMDAWLKSREKEKGTGKFDKRERTLPGGMKATTYTRRHEDDVEDDSDAPASKGGAPKKRGRPMGKPKGPERTTAKAWKHKGERKVKEEETDEGWRGGMHGEPDMVKTRQTTGKSTQEQAYHDLLTGITGAAARNLINPRFAQQLLKLAKQCKPQAELDEKAKSKAQQKFRGMVHATQKGEKAPSKEVGKVAKTMKKSDAKDFASTKHKGLPEKAKAKKEEAKEEKVDETTTSGSVATSSAAPKANKGGMQFGKGVYEGFNNSVEKMITESVDIAETISENEGEGKTVTVTASGAEADMLMQLLKAAGLSGQGAGCGCGQTPCGCEQVDENQPDWPTNTETSSDAFQYSGGLNNPKSTGQTTTPVIASQLRRQVSMEESVELERSLFKTWKNYKG